MKNYEKYKDELYDILTNALAVTKAGELMLCGRIECSECIFDFNKCNKSAREWLNAEYVEKEVDWSLVPKNTQILVTLNGCVLKRYFAQYDADDKLVCHYPNGKTSWTFNRESDTLAFVPERCVTLQRREDIKRYVK